NPSLHDWSPGLRLDNTPIAQNYTGPRVLLRTDRSLRVLPERPLFRFASRDQHIQASLNQGRRGLSPRSLRGGGFHHVEMPHLPVFRTCGSAAILTNLSRKAEARAEIELLEQQLSAAIGLWRSGSRGLFPHRAVPSPGTPAAVVPPGRHPPIVVRLQCRLG